MPRLQKSALRAPDRKEKEEIASALSSFPFRTFIMFVTFWKHENCKLRQIPSLQVNGPSLVADRNACTHRHGRVLLFAFRMTGI